ncbi:MAG: VOC family protein [Bacteroidales bacterium]|nr:VOC family protein [Bacteroidales bacterium]
MIKHVAITVNETEEIKNFYEEVLHFVVKEKFSLNQTIARQIFDTTANVKVIKMQHPGAELEIFLSHERETRIFSHICLAYRNADHIFKKSVEQGYKAIVKENPGKNTYFIWDKSGNMFEIKFLGQKVQPSM